MNTRGAIEAAIVALLLILVLSMEARAQDPDDVWTHVPSAIVVDAAGVQRNIRGKPWTGLVDDGKGGKVLHTGYHATTEAECLTTIKDWETWPPSPGVALVIAWCRDQRPLWKR